MKNRIRTLALLLSTTLVATASAAQPDPAKTRTYIDKAWTTLTRSQDNCAALADPKIKAHPVIYVPAQFTAPADLAQTAKRCNVDVRTLPQVINQLGDVDATKLPVQGLLYLPHPYVVPGGFFNEMYGWDSYFIVLGLVADHRTELARNMTDNALFEVQYYGGVLNANRSYYLSRSQPPFLTGMMVAVLNDPASFKNAEEKRAWLEQAYPLAVRNHDIWTRPEHQAGNTGLARYYDLGSGPVLEAQDSEFYKGVIKWLVEHPAQNPGYLIKAAEHPDDAEAARLKTESCDVNASKVCAGNGYDGYRLTADYYHGDRAMRESGFDTNFHFGPFGGSTHHYAAVDLNSLLYRYELDLHDFAVQLGKTADAERWAKAAAARKVAMNKYLWRPELGMYRDYDFVAGKPSDAPYLTTFYPLWAGAASAQQAAAVRQQLSTFELAGGLAMDNRPSGTQWNNPFGWAPTNWLAVSGLDAYGFHEDARRIAGKFDATVDRSFAADGTIREKYNMALGNADVKVSAGYTTNVIGFGWTNGVYLKLQEILRGTAGKATPVKN
ncbi:trehalase family glycosidase [Dyella caseinilytica]|uniref:Trehalase n=1 Tax=Dyella caseinilytica TaxID=1849581 RepID=A0ABX7GW96_9GAMM|nr:trehalase family glycosidase [Dyella caseinilytica]QRN54328.1 trehalase [Dyella caseinilytica]GFZ93318.1 periplasmic trehalase [Dyella caseinilytica]